MQKHSAVLIGIYQDSIILTKRSVLLKSFTGHICLPGGRYDDTDTDYTMTAIREFNEEVSFIGQVLPLFCLTPEFSPVAKYNVYPIVAKLTGEIIGFNTAEVEKILYLGLDDLTPELFKPNAKMPRILHNWCFNYAGEFVWGLTAQILKELCLYKEIL